MITPRSMVRAGHCARVRAEVRREDGKPDDVEPTAAQNAPEPEADLLVEARAQAR